MRVLLLTQVFPPSRGGSGRWLWELYKRLHDGADFNVHVVTDRAEEAFDASSPVPITRMPLSFANWGLWHVHGARDYARAFWTLRRTVREFAPDAIHCGKCLPEGLLALAFKRTRGTPFTCFVHGEELTLAATSRELSSLTRRVLRAASTVIANSHHTKQLLLEQWQISAERVVVMHPGVDTTRFVPAPRDPVVRARLGWGDRPVVLTAGALQKRKGQDMMIRALPAIRARFPDVLYAMVGAGWERPYLDRLVAEHGVGDLVQFRPPPEDDELIACYQQCDIFALPNRQVGWDFEGFGIVLIEAQACGRPVVAGRSGGTADTMAPSRSGELVSCDAPDELARAVTELLGDAARIETMGACGREWAVEHFDWSALTRRARRHFLAQ